MMRARWLLALVAAAAYGCRSAEGPVAGELAVRLATTRSGDRAILLRVVGRQHGVRAPSASTYRVVSDTSAAGDTTWIAVITPQGSALVSGDVARLAVPDTRRVADYVVSLTDVALYNYLVGDTTGIVLSVVKP